MHQTYKIGNITYFIGGVVSRQHQKHKRLNQFHILLEFKLMVL